MVAGVRLSEPEAGSDPAAMRTTAVRDGDEWVINGTKNWITNAGIADFYVVFAVTDRETRRMSAFVVEKDRPGLTIGKLEHKLGIKGSPTGSPVFDDVRVPPENIIGVEGKGLSVALGTLERTRLGAAAQAVGIAQGATDYANAYAKERIAFGKPIHELQGIQFKLADMETRTAAARELLYKACAMADRGEPASASTRRWPSSSPPTPRWASRVEAIQVLGGYGYVNEYPVERMMRDAKITQIYEGTNEIQRVVIARAMRADGDAPAAAHRLGRRRRAVRGPDGDRRPATASAPAGRCGLIETLAVVGFVAAVVFGGAIAHRAAAGRLTRARVRGGVRGRRAPRRAPGPRGHRGRARRDGVPRPRPLRRRRLRGARARRARRAARPAARARETTTSRSSSPTAGAAAGAYGLYHGDGATRDDVPDRIVIYRDTLRRDFGHDPELLREQVTITVRHELAHHIGFDELGVRDLGL